MKALADKARETNPKLTREQAEARSTPRTRTSMSGAEGDSR